MPSSGVQTCALDRKSTRLNSSHTIISYAVFCLKKNTAAYCPRNNTSFSHAPHTPFAHIAPPRRYPAPKTPPSRPSKGPTSPPTSFFFLRNRPPPNLSLLPPPPSLRT